MTNLSLVSLLYLIFFRSGKFCLKWTNIYIHPLQTKSVYISNNHTHESNQDCYNRWNRN